jgi:NADPH-dependent curcumin reductase CurA
MTVNRQIRLASRPEAIPQAEHFCLAEAPVPEPEDGMVLVRNLFLSVEPAMRGWLADLGNYSAPVEIGDVMRSLAVGRVERSRHPDYQAGELLLGWFGWQSWAAVPAASVVRRIEESDLPPSLALGILGLNGVTAMLALDLIGQPRAGETVVVSTAAGAVGSVVGQLAKRAGCRAVGITGGPAKQRLCIERFGYDAAIDYKSGDLDAAIASSAPDGVDVYFDSTAGAISDAVLRHLNVGARIVICGTASVASWSPPPVGPRVERHMLTKRARMQGFVIFDHMDQFGATAAALAALVREGKLVYEEDVLQGIEQCPGAIARLYEGRNIGKLVIRLQDKP